MIGGATGLGGTFGSSASYQAGGLGALIGAVRLEFEAAALGALFGDRSQPARFPVLGAALAGEISRAGLNDLYGNLIDAPLTGRGLADALMYGSGGSPALDAAAWLNRGRVVDLLG
ncbi:MAG: hypothetical protein JNJ48_07495 [Phycisphaerae bacterium]|nr:hypothetical protein [Phycisphaerae bacterium]